MRKPVEIDATEFKAKCLELLDEVYDHKRNCVIITKRGKPYAKLVPIEDEPGPFYGSLKGLATIRGDITEPIDVEWDALK